MTATFCLYMLHVFSKFLQFLREILRKNGNLWSNHNLVGPNIERLLKLFLKPNSMKSRQTFQ